MRLLTLPILSFLGLLTLAGCQHKDPDPCAAQTPTSAAFTMQEQLGILGKFRRFQVDSAIASGIVPVVFTALDSTAEVYEWRIGTESQPRLGRSIVLGFQNPYDAVDIRLTVKKQPNPHCFPDDDGVDAQQQKLVIIPREESPIIGVYEGYNLSAPGNRFRITIESGGILNLPRGCRYDLRNDFLLGARSVYVFSSVFSQEYGAGAINGWGALASDNRNTIRFEYDYNDATKPLVSSPRLHDTFVGTRVR